MKPANPARPEPPAAAAPPAKPAKPMRLDKYVSAALGLSRAEGRALLAAGKIAVNGAVCKKADTPVTPTGPAADAVRRTDTGAPLTLEGPVYLMLHKPAGVLCATEDARDPTVLDLLGGAWPRRALFPAGRLDKDSTGFVLLTDDGPLAHALLSPARHVLKTYAVTLDTPVTPAMAEGFAAGITLADGTALRPARLTPDAADPCRCTVQLTQGVYHQIKRMFGVYGAGVTSLHRTAIGGVTLDEALAPGQWRPLTPEELALLRQPAPK